MTENRSATAQENWEALAEVWKRFRPRFYRQAFRQLGSREDAEDAVQDALLSALKNFGQFRGQAHISTWLHSIVINSARSILRRQLRHPLAALDQPCDDAGNTTWADLLEDSGPKQDELYVGTELGETFHNLLQQLPAAQRKVCSLRTLDDFSMREIAKELGVPEGTAKAQLARGRAKLGQLLRKARSGGRKPSASGPARLDARSQSVPRII
jgi:RNA polymerase sigma-70 factor, ECF subfamily